MRVGVREAALVAPISGIVGRRHVVPGEKVSAEQQLLTVVDLATLELAGIVGTHEVSLLRARPAGRVQVEGQGSVVPGRIDRIAPAAEAGTRAIGVVVVLDNKDERFRAGQYAQARVALADAAAADDRAGRRRRPGVGPGLRLGDRERARWSAASSSPAAATRRPAASRWRRA